MGRGVAVGSAPGVAMGPVPVHVGFLLSILGPVRLVAVEFLVEEILPPGVGLVRLLLLVPLGKEIFKEGVLLGVDFLLLQQVG